MAAEGQRPEDEGERERLNRNLDQVLEELRLVVPGAQVLLAFLLTAPFSSRFGALSDLQGALYLVSLLAAAGGVVCLMAPTLHHRLTFRRGRKRALVFRANRLAIAGCGLIATAITAALALVVDVIYDAATSALVAAAVALAFVGIWLVPPLLDRDEGPDVDGRDDG